VTLPHFPSDAKPVVDDLAARRTETARRPFHRINAPHYDAAVDGNESRIGNKRRPSGLAKESGARGPEAFEASGFLEHFARLATKLLKSALLAIPVVGQAAFLIDQFFKTLTGKSPLEELFAALAKLASSSVEGALFARLMRAIPAWVPVARRGYRAEFRYEEDGAPRTVDKEEEREVEGFLTASYALHNDVVFTQWSHFRHWAFHVLPTPGFDYLIGRGNLPDPAENGFIDRIDTDINAPLFERALRIYGQQRPGSDDPDRGAVECLFDVGAITKPPGDGGFHGVHFSGLWPYWPMAGDYFWAAGRWSYDCMRATATDKTEVYPTQINPIKTFAAARYEGVKFPENESTVEAVRFFFFASAEGGFRDFHVVPGRKGPPGQPHVTLRDRDYEFVVDLPSHAEGRSAYPVGSTIDFAFNTLVIRPRLLVQVRTAPFAVGGKVPQFAEGLKAVAIEPKIELLRPSKPTERPQQVKITIPLSQLPAADPQAREMVGLDIALGWHDPTGEELKELVLIDADIRFPRFYSQSGPVRLMTAINGRWSILTEKVEEEPDEPPSDFPPPGSRSIHRVRLFLPKEAPVSIVAGGIWFHGFGEFMEGDTLAGRRLRVGGVLANVDDDTKKRLQGVIDDVRKTVNDLRKAGQTVKDPKGRLKAEIQKQIDEERKKGTNPQALAELQKQMDDLVDGLPDTPDGIQAALDALDRRLTGILDVLDGIEEFLKATDDLIGERYFPVWHEDIDNEQKTGVEESKRVSAIARTMFIHPTPVVNRHDEPMGWVEFVDRGRGTLGREPSGALIVPNPLGRGTAGELLKLADANGGKPIRMRLVAPPFTAVGSGNNLARRINPPQERSDYEFQVNLEVHRFPFPAPKSGDPEVS
jgi:hypothetical protein